MSSLRAWLELTRISNLPTVVSNVIAGAVLGGICVDHSAWEATAQLFVPSLLWLGLCIPCIVYIAGMILNDACDARIDTKERAARPIPSGRVSRGLAFVTGFTLLAAAVGLAFLTHDHDVVNATIALVSIVLIYDFLHAAHWSTVIFLALARAHASLIPMLAYAQDASDHIFERPVILLPIALAAWTLALSVLARGEVSATRAFARPHAIGWMIACIPLVDMIAMLFAAAWGPASLCLSLLILTRLGQRRIEAS